MSAVIKICPLLKPRKIVAMTLLWSSPHTNTCKKEKPTIEDYIKKTQPKILNPIVFKILLLMGRVTNPQTQVLGISG